MSCEYQSRTYLHISVNSKVIIFFISWNFKRLYNMHSFHDLKGITVRLILKLGIFSTVNVAYRHKWKFYPRGTQGLESEITKA